VGGILQAIPPIEYENKFYDKLVVLGVIRNDKNVEAVLPLSIMVAIRCKIEGLTFQKSFPPKVLKQIRHSVFVECDSVKKSTIMVI